MKLKRIVSPVAEYYRDLRLHNLTSRKYNHILMALYWNWSEKCGEIEVVQMHLDQTVLSSSSISEDGNLDLTLNDFGDETAW